MATAKKLPSGSWRCQVYDYTDENGKRHYKSFTSTNPKPAGKREAEAAAAAYALKKESKRKETDLTVGECIDRYLAAKKGILSESTIRAYKISQRLHFNDLGNIKVSQLSNEQVQKWLTSLLPGRSPKTVRNIYGLLTSSVYMFSPDTKFRVQLPEKKPPVLYVPSDADVVKLLNVIEKDRDLTIAVLLAAFGPMRRGEICALEYSDIRGNTVIVSKGMILTENKEWIIKAPKTLQSNRSIPLPEFVVERIGKGEGRILQSSPDQISNRFIDAVKRAGLPHFRFHDLRHYAASIMHAIGIPDQYIIERGGWKTDGVMKTIYRNSIDDITASMNQKANDHFTSIISN